MKRFTGTFRWAQTSYFWRVAYLKKETHGLDSFCGEFIISWRLIDEVSQGMASKAVTRLASHSDIQLASFPYQFNKVCKLWIEKKKSREIDWSQYYTSGVSRIFLVNAHSIMSQESYLCERIRFIIAQAQQKIQSSLDIATVKTRQEIIITMDRNQEGKSN